MKERPILLRDWEVLAVLEGRKSQFRRPVKRIDGNNLVEFRLNSDGRFHVFEARYCNGDIMPTGLTYTCPFGQPGDRLWVRETWAGDRHCGFAYRADHPDADLAAGDLDDGDQSIRRWRPSIHMPRWASRLTLEVKAVRVERVQEISEADAISEGATRREITVHSAGWSVDWSRVGRLSRFAGGIHPRGKEQPLTERDICLGSARMAFANGWDRINAKCGFGWEANPFVWAVEFEPIAPTARQDGSGDSNDGK